MAGCLEKEKEHMASITTDDCIRKMNKLWIFLTVEITVEISTLYLATGTTSFTTKNLFSSPIYIHDAQMIPQSNINAIAFCKIAFCKMYHSATQSGSNSAFVF